MVPSNDFSGTTEGTESVLGHLGPASPGKPDDPEVTSRDTRAWGPEQTKRNYETNPSSSELLSCSIETQRLIPEKKRLTPAPQKRVHVAEQLSARLPVPWPSPQGQITRQKREKKGAGTSPCQKRYEAMNPLPPASIT
ncbi:hypothetical protein E2C01_052749 [Portunus trituberculatus]|uniref:Uncharacterized protein n=1 Tax=Portunus trituberculatus TaxID=210409 RepID=A0A5B7GEI7_PORTR|nr:hypothetical protein [Portunus trituberculatus]